MSQEPDAEESARVRDYLVAQVKRYDLLALWPRVIAERTALLLAFDRVNDEQSRWRPPSPDGEWNLLEIAQHAIVWARSVNEIIEALAAGRSAEALALGHLDRSVVANIDDARRALSVESVRLAALPGQLPAAANLEATAEHPRFGPLNYRAWFLFSRLHDGDHLQQVEMLKAADGYPS